MDRSLSDRKRRQSDGEANVAQKLKRRKTEPGSSISTPSSVRRTEFSFLGFDSPGPYWKKTNLSNSTQTPKKKGKYEDTESPTKELRSKLQSINLGDEAEIRDSFEIETEDFRLPDEQDSSDDEDEILSQGEEFASLPVRYLDGFTFFDDKSGEMIGLDYLEEPDIGDDISPYFTGRVIARNLQFQEDDESVDSEDSVSEVPPVMLRSSSVLTVWESEEPEEDGVVSENSDIWVRTSYAWYILDRPAPAYRNTYLPRWLHHKLYILVLHLRQRATPTVSHFERHFLKNEATWATYEFGRELTLNDLEKRMPEVLRSLKEDDYDLHDCPFIEELCSKYAPGLGIHQPFCSRRKRRREARPPMRQRDIRLTKTFCTEFVWEISRPYFPSLRRRYAEARVDSGSQDEEITLVETLSWPKALSGRLQSIKGDKMHGASNSLNWIKMRGGKYKVGDIVMMRHDDTPEPLSGHPRDSVWFGLIILLFIEQDEKTSSDSDDEKTSSNSDDERTSSDSDDEISVKAHILWLIPASHSSLNQLAHPQELVVIDECAEVDVASFIAVCPVSELQPGEPEPEIDENVFSFFYRYLWLGAPSNDDAFVDVDTFLKRKFPHNSQSAICPSCRNAKKGELEVTPRNSQHGILFNKVEYHIHDNVYIVPDENCTVYVIGQIIEITPQHVLVRQFNRAVRPEGPHRFYNDRLLTFDSRSKPVKFQVDRIEGKCVVIPPAISQANLAEDVFYLDNMDKLPTCHLCSRSSNRAPVHGPPLMGLDLFSGAGGLSLGLESTGLVKTGWAVEFDASAARTFSESHPHSIVYNACLNQLLHHTADIQQGIQRVPIKSLDTKEDLPPFPVEGDVDIVFGGPPCQGFSMLNHCPRADDPRNQLILAFLSSVDILKPKYVILENVRGILMFRLGSHQVGLTRVEGGVPGGMVMLIKRILMGLNYQVRHGVLQAGHYGSPQVRRRVIFMASRRGILLPDLPQPTHLSTNSHSLGVKVIANKGYGFTVDKRTNQAAPLGPVTVMDAIGDLPSWEWSNPHIIVPQTLQSKATETKRGQLIYRIPASYKPPSLEIRGSGPDDPMPYGTLPATSYQAWSRGSQGKVTQHFTQALSAPRVERVCSIPLRSNDKSKRFPNYDDLPEELKTRGRKHAYYGGGYGRLEANGAFPTAVGTITPDAKHSQVIHPNQHRVITIREFARSQGFPDRVKFHHVSSDIKQITKQIGNAVPVPMAAAIGREIVKAESRLRRLEEKQARAKREESFEL